MKFIDDKWKVDLTVIPWKDGILFYQINFNIDNFWLSIEYRYIGSEWQVWLTTGKSRWQLKIDHSGIDALILYSCLELKFLYYPKISTTQTYSFFNYISYI